MRLTVLSTLLVVVIAVSAETVRSHLPARTFRSNLRGKHLALANLPSQNSIAHRQPTRQSLPQRAAVLPSSHTTKSNRKRTRGPVPPAVLPTKKSHFLRPSKRTGPPAMKPPRGIIDKLNKAASNDFRRLAALILRRHKQ